MSDRYPPSDTRPLVELKNGKLTMRQKPFSLEKSSETMQEIVQFREMLQTRITQNASPLEIIPEAYNPLIAKFVHESDKTLQALTKHVHSQLLPSDIDEEDEDTGGSYASDQLPLCCVESAITHVATRVNYGAESMPNQTKVPAHLCVWRWEVDEQNFHWLPKTARDKLRNRLYERRQVRGEVATLLGSSPAPGKTTIPNDAQTKPDKDVCLMVTDQQEALSSGSVNKAADKKSLKSKEKLQPKGTKLEKQLKARESRTRSQNLMADFLAKSKVGSSVLPTKQKEVAKTTDFDKMFKPFALRRGVEVAPISYFGASRGRLKGVEDNPIAALDGGVSPLSPPPALVIQPPPFSLSDRLRDITSSMPHVNPLRHQARTSRQSSRDSVRTILNELAEAEVTGDISTTRSLLNLLEDRSIIPAKVFIFHEDTRPGYLGTWTRVSPAVRPRSPLTRDVVAVDYSYDSSEEWEEENTGDADDIADDNDDDDELDAGDDSDADSWLVDDEDMDAVVPADEVDNASPHLKRQLEETSGGGNSYKKRKVVPLVPFVKGPVWDPAIAKTVEEAFTPFRVRFFNDNLHPIDPFTCVSSLETTTQIAANRTFLVPPIPEHAHSVLNEHQPGSLNVAKKALAGPKHPFPEAHVPILVSRINELATGSIVLIVETLYQELKGHKVKKNSIEAKVKEVAVKRGRVWVAQRDPHSDSLTQPKTT